MDKKVAEKLVDELERQHRAIPIDKGMFIDILMSFPILKSSRFYEELPDKQQLIEESGRYHYFSLRRVLRNKNAKNYRLSRAKQAYEALASTLGIYSSDVLSRKLRADKELVKMIADNENPYSLLGKFKTYDFDNPDETLFIMTKPVLAIPDAKNIAKISDWEEANTIYEKEVGIFFRHPKIIKSQEYFCH